MIVGFIIYLFSFHIVNHSSILYKKKLKKSRAEQQNIIQFDTKAGAKRKGRKEKQTFPLMCPLLFKILETFFPPQNGSSSIKTCSTSFESAFEVS